MEKNEKVIPAKAYRTQIGSKAQGVDAIKKVLCFVLLISLLWLISGCSQEKEFVFKNGIKWGMTKDEVLAAEDPELHFTYMEPGGYTQLFATAAPLSNYHADLFYFFRSGKLCTISYLINNYFVYDSVPAKMDDLLPIFEKKYGKEQTADIDKLYADLKAHVGDMSEMKITDCHLFSCGKTNIWLFEEHVTGEDTKKIYVCYFSPEIPIETNTKDQTTLNLDGI